MPEHLDLHLRDSAMVQQILAMERRVDATLARKYVDIQHALHPPKQRANMTPQILRIFLWHEHASGSTPEESISLGINGAAPQREQAEGSSWMLKMQGHILEADPQTHSSSAPVARCLSNYLSGLVVQIHGRPAAAAAAPSAGPAAAAASSSAAPITETLEWRKHSSVALADGFEIRRRGLGDVHLQLSLFLDHSPPRFRLAPALARALGFPSHAPNPVPAHATPANPHPFPLLETQAVVLDAFWEYVKKHGLQERGSNTIRCDASLSALFGVSSIPVDSVLSALQLHMFPAAAEPVVLPYHITSSTATAARPVAPHGAASAHLGAPPAPTATPSPSHVTAYDILTYAPMLPALTEAFQDTMTYCQLGRNVVPAPPNIKAEADKMTNKVSELLLDLDKCHRRRVLLQSFSDAPLQTMQMILAQQAKDTLLMTSVSGVDDELERRGEFFHGEWMYDAVDRYQQEEAQAHANSLHAAANLFARTEGEED